MSASYTNDRNYPPCPVVSYYQHQIISDLPMVPESKLFKTFIQLQSSVYEVPTNNDISLCGCLL